MMRVLAALLLIAGGSVPAAAISPVYSQYMTDCNTGSNQTSKTDGKFGWSVSAGCDSYQNESYERPTTQSFEVMNKQGGGTFFGAKEYFQNLDIVKGQAGADNNYLYISIKLNGLNRLTENGVATFESLVYWYGIILSKNADGANGWLMWADQPSLANGGSEMSPNTSFTALKTFGQQDTNGDVGGSGINNGLSITKSNNASAAVGNGFDLARIQDGKLDGGTSVLFARVNPVDHSEVEFAIRYSLLGFTLQDVRDIISGASGYLDMRSAKGGPKDPQNFMWNDEYTLAEAGSPYRSQSPNGTQNIYEVDTLQFADPVPEPATWLSMIMGFGVVGAVARRRRAMTA
ncbi:PEPxxWA-CTERM sorting domain-containing protein [Sandarakinorhabdus sp.]|jgi:hypothetical protein|uniref:PEPxxWA-CTERM sorting domain-containing protein n=1 Tax=Sandarakinorhabdus sp. TaxID=1916663 RepID=UPI003342A6C8